MRCLWGDCFQQVNVCKDVELKQSEPKSLQKAYSDECCQNREPHQTLNEHQVGTSLWYNQSILIDAVRLELESNLNRLELEVNEGELYRNFFIGVYLGVNSSGAWNHDYVGYNRPRLRPNAGHITSLVTQG